MELKYSFESSQVREYMWKQLRAVNRKYRDPDIRMLNKKVAAVISILRYPDFKLEYANGVYAITLTTEDMRWDHIAIYVTMREYEVRIPTGFLRSNDVREVRAYVEKI